MKTKTKTRIIATQSICRNKRGGLMGGAAGVSNFAGAGLDLAGDADVVLAGAPEDGCFLSFGTFIFPFRQLTKSP